MLSDIRDDTLMRRFLVEDVTPEERDRIEAAFAGDPDYFDALCALEEEMLVEHLSGQLEERWRERFEATLSASPARRRRLREIRALQLVLGSQPSVVTLSALDRRPPHTGAKFPRWFAAAAVLALVLGGGAWWLRTSSAPGTAPSVETPPAARRSFETFALASGQTRSDLRQTNVFAVPRVDDVHLEIRIANGDITAPAAELRHVGEAPLPIATAPREERRGAETTVVWVIPAMVLVRGDYVLTVTGEISPGVRDAVGSAFFSIVE